MPIASFKNFIFMIYHKNLTETDFNTDHNLYLLFLDAFTFIYNHDNTKLNNILKEKEILE